MGPRKPKKMKLASPQTQNTGKTADSQCHRGLMDPEGSLLGSSAPAPLPRRMMGRPGVPSAQQAVGSPVPSQQMPIGKPPLPPAAAPAPAQPESTRPPPLPQHSSSPIRQPTALESMAAVTDALLDEEPPLFIGVAGGTASGKTTVCSRIIQKLHDDGIIRPDQNVVVVCQDSFYRPLTPDQSALAKKQQFNFDVPSAFDFPLLLTTLQRLLKRQPVDIPIYNFVTHSRHESVHHIERADVVILEGILALFDESIVGMMSMKLFVEADPDERLARRIARDTVERGRELGGIIAQYLTYVKPAYDRYILPTKAVADIVIQKGGENMVAVNLICGHIRQALDRQRRRRQAGRQPSPPPLLGASPVVVNLH
ncbi:putative Uridine-cytidine kinase 2-B [Paratrimastix pyriformis]|uniref:uridine/cytidine kinase n=1 Tax=Paratrimastix pyriformis TaxID=342808 RepID=A0ABQ8UAA0_9EUKA|nr:putative Uridine-cytidine kinase 2-B [Paratrimastix pyriformis]